MAMYLIVLVVMSVSAAVLAFVTINAARKDRKLNIYDARGFFIVALVFITFGMTSLAYFWGDSRFNEDFNSVSPSVIGVLIALLASIASLSIGLMCLKDFRLEK